MRKKSANWVQVKDRFSVLNAARNLKMARSTQAYVRGSTVKFYEWLDSSPPSRLPEGPAIWICGDCHVGNLGPIADTKGEVAIEIRDFDQAVIGNPAHDLIRLGLSLAMSARDSDLPGVTTVKIVEQLMLGYEQVFTKTGNLMTKMEKPAEVKIAMKQALHRSWKQLANARIGGPRPNIPLGKRFWPLTKAEHAALSGLFEGEDVEELKAAFRPNGGGAPIKVIDAAYWMKGCSSLGLLRYAVLIEFEEKAGHGNDLYLVDIKEAVKTAAPRDTGAKIPRDNAIPSPALVTITWYVPFDRSCTSGVEEFGLSNMRSALFLLLVVIVIAPENKYLNQHNEQKSLAARVIGTKENVIEKICEISSLNLENATKIHGALCAHPHIELVCN